MKTEALKCEAQVITDAPGLDPITVFWVDFEPGRGSVTAICYGSAWTAYFGGMMGQSIREFFRSAGTDYLVTKMGITPHLKATKRDHAYLAKIIKAIQASLNTPTSSSLYGPSLRPRQSLSRLPQY